MGGKELGTGVKTYHKRKGYQAIERKSTTGRDD
jgi:hypothetical protein